MLSHAENSQAQFRSSFGVTQRSGFHCSNNLAVQWRGNGQVWFQLAMSCSGGKPSLRKELETLRRVKCCISGTAGEETEAMQLLLKQNLF